MKFLLSAAALAIGAAAAPLALADTSITTGALDLSISNIYWTPGSLQVLSNDGTTVRIGISGAEPLINPVISHAPTFWEYENGDYGGATLTGKLLPGYRITSMTLSGMVSGGVEVMEPADLCDRCQQLQEGDGGNYASVSWTVNDGSGAITLPGATVADTIGQANYSTSATTSLQGDFEVNLYTVLSAWNKNPVYDDGYPWDYDYIIGDTKAWVQMSDVVLTMQVSAVPEPSAYAMLLGGAGVLLVATRRRKERACASMAPLARA